MNGKNCCQRFAQTGVGAGLILIVGACVGVSLLAQAKPGVRQARGREANASLDPAVEQHIQRDRIVDLTQKMIKIDSQYEKGVVVRHKAIVDFIATEIKAMGLEVEVIRQNPDYPIVIGRLKGSGGGPALGITELYNTVYVGNRKLWTVDPFGGVVKNGRIYGRGAANSKGSLAASLVAARALKESGLKMKGDLVLLYTPGEGGEEFCLPWLVDHQPDLIRANWYLAGGHGGDITRIAGGHVWVKLVVHGTQAHPGAAVQNRLPVNAIHKLAAVIPAVMDVDSWMKWEPNPLFSKYVSSRGVGKPFAEVDKITGGYEVNMVPDYAEADIDVRVFPKQTPEGVLKELKALFARLEQKDTDLHVEVQPIGGQVVPYEYWSKLTEDDPFIKKIFEVAPAYTGKRPEWQMSAGGGRPDLWKLGSKWISFGIINSGNAHGTDEWVDIDSLVQHSRLYADLAVRTLR